MSQAMLSGGSASIERRSGSIQTAAWSCGSWRGIEGLNRSSVTRHVCVDES